MRLREARRLVSSWGPVRLLRAEALAALPPALARRVVRALLASVRGGTAGLDAASVDRVLALEPAGAVSVTGGAEVTANAGWLAAAPADLADLPPRTLAVGGAVELPELGLAMVAREVAAEWVVPPRARPPRPEATTAHLRPEPLLVRARRPGDRVPGSRRSLGDRMTDLGVPRAVRGLVPVVAFAAAPDEAVWVPGVAAPAPGLEGPVPVRLVPGTSTTIAS
jgi:hypothetical protein